MVAAMCAWHEHHEPVAGELERRLDRGETMVVAAPALVEAYAVLTRLPFPHRLSPSDSLALLEANFISQARTIALDARSYQNLLRSAPRDNIAGGRTYDAVIIACALKAKVSALLTFNTRDFLAFSAEAMEIVVPS